MTPAEPTIPPTPGQRRARDAAERAEFSALLARLRVLQPNFDCFCGSLDDLRRTVADLDRRAQQGQPGLPTRRAAIHDPQLTARLAAVRAAGHTVLVDETNLADRREQLNRWQSYDASTDPAKSASGGDDDG